MISEEEKINNICENIVKIIDKLRLTSSVNSEANLTENLVDEIKKIDINRLVEFSKELDVFGKSVLYYRLPIEYRLNKNLSDATRVLEEERASYYNDFKNELINMKLNPEDEYNKKILMACTLHVPLGE